MVFVLLNIRASIQVQTGRKSALIQLEIICQYISYSMLLNSDSHLTAEVGAKYLVALRFLVTNISSSHRQYSAYHNVAVHHFGRKTESRIV